MVRRVYTQAYVIAVNVAIVELTHKLLFYTRSRVMIAYDMQELS